MPKCPICSADVANQRGLAAHFRHQAATHPSYSGWLEDQEWSGKRENQDFVVCRECGKRDVTLARHLMACHGITAEEYRIKHGPGVLIRATSLTERRSRACRVREGGFGKGELKAVTCPGCGSPHQVSKFLVPGMHDDRCLACRTRGGDSEWEGKSEPLDFVTCRVCGHRAENLCSHIQSAHPDLVGRYAEVYSGALVVALGSSIRDKSRLRGMVRSPEFGRKIAEARRIDLTLADFGPYLDDDGSVDHRAMIEATGIWYPTLKRYMADLGLRPTYKYVAQRGADRRVRLSLGDLEPYVLGNGKVSLAGAVIGLGHSLPTLRKECFRLGLSWAHGNVSQARCLSAISHALGGSPYQQEWSSPAYVNPKTGRRFRFDGFFPEENLIAEFHGHQHFIFPNAFMGPDRESVYREMKERDRIKESLIRETPGMLHIVIREDEPFTDVSYLRARLLLEGAASSLDNLC